MPEIQPTSLQNHVFTWLLALCSLRKTLGSEVGIPATANTGSTKLGSVYCRLVLRKGMFRNKNQTGRNKMRHAEA